MYAKAIPSIIPIWLKCECHTCDLFIGTIMIQISMYTNHREDKEDVKYGS